MATQGLSPNNPVPVDYALFREGNASTASLPQNFFDTLVNDYPPTPTCQSINLYIAISPDDTDPITRNTLFTFADNNKAVPTVQRRQCDLLNVKAQPIMKMANFAKVTNRTLIARACYNYNTKSILIKGFTYQNNGRVC